MAFQIIAITNRALCAQPLEVRVAALCDAGVDRVIVREKDLTEREFGALLDRIEARLTARSAPSHHREHLRRPRSSKGLSLDSDEATMNSSVTPISHASFRRWAYRCMGSMRPSTPNDRELISASLATSSPPNASLAWSHAVLISSGASLRTRPFPSMRSAVLTRTISLRCAMLVRMAHA